MIREPLKITLACLGTLLLVTLIACLIWAVTADRQWERSGGHRMKMEMNAVSLTGYAQEENAVVYYNDIYGLQLPLPPGWNIDQDEWKQPLRVLCTSPEGTARLYVYMSRNPQDFRQNAMSQTILDLWQMTGHQTTETINGREWQIDTGTLAAHGMKNYSMYVSTSAYWGLAIVYMSEAEVDEELVASVVGGVDIYRNYDNTGNRGAANMGNAMADRLIKWGPLLATHTTADDTEWHPLDALQDALGQ